MKSNQEIIIDCDYNTARFDGPTIQRWLGHFQTLLEALLTDPGQRLIALPLLTAKERELLLTQWDDTAVEYAPGQCLHHLFEAQAERTPEAVALTL